MHVHHNKIHLFLNSKNIARRLFLRADFCFCYTELPDSSVPGYDLIGDTGDLIPAQVVNLHR